MPLHAIACMMWWYVWYVWYVWYDVEKRGGGVFPPLSEAAHSTCLPHAAKWTSSSRPYNDEDDDDDDGDDDDDDDDDGDDAADADDADDADDIHTYMHTCIHA